MPHGYCTECEAQVTVRNGQCLLDHVVDPGTIEETPGRRLRPSARRRRGTHAPRSAGHQAGRRHVPAVEIDPAPLGGGLALLERTDESFQFDLRDQPVEQPPEVVERSRLARPVTDAETLSITGLLVEELWNLSPDDDIVGWTPGEVDESLVFSGVRKRKLVAIGALVVVALLVGWRALTWDSTQAAASIAAVTEASTELVGQLGTLDTPIADIADGRVDDPLGASTSLARLDEAARHLFTLAGEMPTDTEMAPVREQAITQAGGALDLATTLSESFAYASAVELVTRPLELPTETDIDGLSVLTANVTSWVGDFTSGVSSLPENELTDTHRDALVDLSDSLGEWQAAYLDALRARDTARAGEHIAELGTQMSFVRESWDRTAASIAEWATQRTSELAVPLVVNR